MNLQIAQGSENYAGIVCKVSNIIPIEGADKIQLAIVEGNSVVVSKSTKVGDLGLFFCSGTQLSEDYCKLNNLYDDPDKNLDTSEKGYISSKQRRVKAIKLRGAISNGMFMPIHSLDYISEDVFNLKEGQSFTSINGLEVCRKFIVIEQKGLTNTPAKPKSPKFNRLIDNQFILHNNTSNLRHNIKNIEPDDIIGIHYKKHGTSAVFANIPTLRRLSWWERFLMKLGIKVNTTVYDIIYSSRTVIKNENINSESGGGFYGEDIWKVVKDEISRLIPKNWTLYGEIIGFMPSGQSIQKKYDYGCKVGEHKFYVYKISVNNPDGKVIYLTDLQIKEFCDSVGLLYSDTFMYYGKAKDLFPIRKNGNIKTWRQNFLEFLEKTYNDKNCYMCVNKVPEEGIVLRKESLFSYEAYKLKSKGFILQESKQQEENEYNIEDNS